jgi:inner membrane transporter RhtA
MRPRIRRVNGRGVAIGLVIVAAVSPQVGAAVALTLFDGVGPAGAAFLRLVFAALALWVIWRPRLEGNLRLAGAFGVALGLMNWTFYESIARIPLAVAVTIEFAGPLLVAVLGSRRLLDVVWVVLAAVGIVLLVAPDAGGVALDPIGIAFAVAAGVCWMAYIYLSKRVGAAFRGGSGLAIAMAVGAIIVLPAGLIEGGAALASGDMLAGAVLVALTSSVVPYSLELVALRRLPEALFGVLMSLDPAIAALIGFVLLRQELGPRELVAVALVVVASVGAAALGQHDEPAGGPAVPA